MNMQGKPIGNSGLGGKVTTDPASNNAISENTGPVTSDSLAAESANSGGAFSENRGAPQKIAGSNSTFNNTDTSAATELGAAPNKSVRDDAPGGSEGPIDLKYPEGSDGQSGFPGQHNEDGYVDGSASANEQIGFESSGAYRTSSSVDQTAGQTKSSRVQQSSSGQPSGRGVTEGGFDSNSENNASFNTELGTEDDPGRQAIKDMQKKSQAASGATGPRQPPGQEGTGPYDTLNSEEQA